MVARTSVYVAALAVVVEEAIAGAVATWQTVEVRREPRVSAAVGALEVPARARQRRTVGVAETPC